MATDVIVRYEKDTDEYECARLYDELCAEKRDGRWVLVESRASTY